MAKPGDAFRRVDRSYVKAGGFYDQTMRLVWEAEHQLYGNVFKTAWEPPEPASIDEIYEWYRRLGRKAKAWARDLDHQHVLRYDLERDWWTCQLEGCDHRVTAEGFDRKGLPPSPIPPWLEGEEGSPLDSSIHRAGS